jgi:Leucine-rich repeat (LRR) protein
VNIKTTLCRTLDLSNNKIGSLPDEMVQLQLMERLDLTSNDLTILPFTLGLLPHLKTVQVLMKVGYNQ